jgi:flagellar biosynthesis/type III secretory pathway chaperone
MKSMLLVLQDKPRSGRFAWAVSACVSLALLSGCGNAADNGADSSAAPSLASVDADRLAEQAARKSGLFEQLTDAARRRQVALSTLGFTPDRPGMEAWIACQPNASSLQKEWQGLREDLEAAQDINRANGQLIEEHSRVNRQALGVLLQGSGRGVYGPDGRTSGLGTGRRLGSA